MAKSVVITEDILIEHFIQAVDNLNKETKLSATLTIFAAILGAEVSKTFFNESEKEN